MHLVGIHARSSPPAEAGEEQRQRAHRVDVDQGVEREPPLLLRRRIPQEMGRKTVRPLVEGDADRNGH